jgi:hypothetical protein
MNLKIMRKSIAQFFGSTRNSATIRADMFQWRNKACHWPVRMLLGGMLTCACGGMVQAATAPFGVPVRVSVKFILNASGDRSPTGSINTDAEVQAQFARSSQIFSRFTSEIRLHEVEILEVSGQSTYYDNNASEASRDEIRNAAIASPAAFFWRNNAVNLYITGSSASAIADFPPNNNIVIMCQGSFDTTMAHELGHILNLYHTHSTAIDDDDGCSDTLRDDEDWNKDQIANNAYGLTYANCSVGQKFNVDMTFSNLMSYHDPDNRSMIAPCQMDRQSTQVWDDRNYFLSKLPIYIQNGYGGSQAGSFTQPYATIQGAINAGVLNNRVMVLKAGTHANPASAISTRTDLVTRRGTSVVQEKTPEFDLPYDLENSKNAAVRAAILRVQASDKKKDVAAALAALLEAEKAATGREKHSIQLELAQRMRDASRFEEAQQWFQKVADATEQPGLRKHALRRADTMKEKALEQKQKPKPDAPGVEREKK